MDRFRPPQLTTSLKKLMGNPTLDPEHSYEVQVSSRQQLEQEIQGNELLAWKLLYGYLKSASSRVRKRAMGVVGEMVITSDEFRTIVMKKLKEIVRLCCPVPGANLPKKDTAGLTDMCKKYLKRWEERFDSQYPQIKYTLQVALQSQETPSMPNLESIETAMHKSKVIFDIHQTEFTEQEKDILHTITETKECIRLYEEWNRSISGLVNLPIEEFSVETLRSVFGLESVKQEMEKTQAKELVLIKLGENVKLLQHYSRLLSNTYQHCEMALQVFTQPMEPYHSRVVYFREKVVKLMRDCQRQETTCNALITQVHPQNSP